MVYKKIILILTIFIVSLFAISSISAADNVTSDVVSMEETDALSVDEAEVVSAEDNQVILGNGSNVGTFDELSSLIENTSEGMTLELDKDYKYVTGSNEGIQINKAITIDGKGHTLDGNYLSRAFYISSSNVTLRNIELTNCYSSSSGGAIFWSESTNFDWLYIGDEFDNGLLYNCSFVNCSSNINGGAVDWCGSNGILCNCSFVNCSAYDDGGAIYCYCSNSSMLNCSFVNCSASEGLGGAIDVPVDYVTIKDSKFNNCHGKYSGGIEWYGEYGVLSNCTFVDCYLTNFDKIIRQFESAGAVVWLSSNGNLTNCNFINCYSNYYNSTHRSPGAIFAIGSNSIISDCNFINCTSNTYSNSVYDAGPGALNIKGINLINCSFINCYSNYNGSFFNNGSILFENASTTIENLNFINCSRFVFPEPTYIYMDIYSDSSVDWVVILVRAGMEQFYTKFKYNINDGKNVTAVSGPGGGTYIRNLMGKGKINVYYEGNENYLPSNVTALFDFSESIKELEVISDVPKTFTDLANKINSGKSEIVLNCDYIYDPTKDSIYQSGVGITKSSITIDGKGHIIDGNCKSKLLVVTGRNITLKNIVFTNSFSSSSQEDGAVLFSSDGGVLQNCSFVNISAKYGTSALSGCYNSTVTDCYFANNYARSYGHTVTLSSKSTITNCIFVNNTSEYYGGAIYLTNDGNSTICNCIFINNTAEGGGAIHSGSGQNNIINCSFLNNHAKSWGGAMWVVGDEVNIIDCYYFNNTAPSGSAIQWYGIDGVITNSSFINNIADSYGGALEWGGKYGKMITCTFKNNVPNSYSGDITIIKKQIFISMSNHSFYYNQPINLHINLNNVSFNSNVILNFFDGNVTKIFDSFLNNNTISLSDEYDALNIGIWNVTVLFEGDDNYYPYNATATITVLPASTSLTIDDVNATVGHQTTLIANVNSTLTVNEGFVTFYDGENNIGESQVSDGVATLTYTPATAGEHNITAIFSSDNYLSSNSTAKLLVDSATVEVLVDVGTYGFESTFIANVKGLYSTINDGTVTFYIDNQYIDKVSVVNGTASISYIPLVAGNHVIKAIYNGNDKFLSDEGSANYIVGKADSRIEVNITGPLFDLNYGIYYVFEVSVFSLNNLTINEGDVCINRGNMTATGMGVKYWFNSDKGGNFSFDVIYDGTDNYLSSNTTFNLLFDSALVDIFVDKGVVGYTSNIIVNITGLYSVINEGNVTFYINDNYMGETSIINKTASINYTPLNIGNYTVKVVFNGNENFIGNENTTVFEVIKADSKVSIEDIGGIVGHDITITVNITSPNNLTIDEGYVVFFDGSTQIGEANVSNGKVTFTHTQTIAGNHSITAWFNSDNYHDSISSALLTVAKGNIDLSIDYISDVYFANPSNFVVNVNSNYKPVNEGKIKYYVNNEFVGTADVYGGYANFNYVTGTAGSFTLTAIYEETANYLEKNASTTFTVNKMPTSLSGESVIFDEETYKTFTTELKDNNNNGVGGQPVKIEVIKYSGESATFNGISDENGITIYDVSRLAGGMWYVTGIYAGDENYIDSRFTDKFIVVRMSTTTVIEEIDNPKVNHTYKLKVNIHDENGKLVKDGILQFYLDGVDIGFIDLSKNQGHQNALSNGVLGAINPIFTYELGADEEVSDLYIEYIPTKAGKHTLLAVYGGTTIYKASNSTTTFIVTEETNTTEANTTNNTGNASSTNTTNSTIAPEINIPSLDEHSNDGSIPVILPSDATGTVTLIVNGKDYKFDVKDGVANVKLPDLSNGDYPYTISYSGDAQYSPFTSSGSFKVNNTTVNPVDNTTDTNNTDNTTNGNTTNTTGGNESEAKPIPEIVVPPLDIPSDDGSVAITLPSDATGTVTLTVEGKDYVFDIVNGKADVKLPDLSNGDYPYTITYSGDSKYSSFTNNGSLKVNKTSVNPIENQTNSTVTPIDNKTDNNTTENNTSHENTTVVDNSKIVASNVNVVYSAGSYYTITVYGTDGKLANGESVKVTGKISKLLTTNNGVAKFKIDQVPGTYKITISALGKSVTKTITVKHLVTLKTTVIKKSAKKLTLQATLGKVNGKYLKKKTITFKINGKKVATAKTNNKGVAKITIKNPNVVKKLKVGKKVTYQATYLKDTVKKTTKIKK